MILATLQTYVPAETATEQTSLLPFMLLGALFVGAGLLVLGFLAFRWKRPEAVGMPVAQESHNDGKLDPIATEEAMHTQEEVIGRVPQVGLVSGQDRLDPPRPSPIAAASITHH